MVEAYSMEGRLLARYKNLHEYAKEEQQFRKYKRSELSHRLNTIYVAAYMTIQNPGRYTYSHIHQENVMFKIAAKKIPTPNKTI